MGQRPLPLLEGPLPLFSCLSGCDKIGPMRIIRQNLSCSYTDASIFTTSYPPSHITGYHQTGTSLVVRRSSIPFLCLPLMGQFTYLQLFTQKMFGYCIWLPVISWSCICLKGYMIFLVFVVFEIRL